MTQTLDEEGNLIGVKEKVNFEEREAAERDTTEKRNELYKEAVERKLKNEKND